MVSVYAFIRLQAYLKTDLTIFKRLRNAMMGGLREKKEREK